ncbi:hypothetical protein BDP81DRAFT_193832 [Colletotrichum phormii]|uniref:Uncharacterized protein n=1 Tax=Colletotrichum phormii TaxID=359342 RepID=A0AAJ0EHF1_9PEZI|nr:uncharacterized protein BDP81DRAFT_193832 [Colletotrichum phormii]KAK1638949.1 hypothetical protein BDP81DRAFT_193832 [Colletotrichum phormii]
MMNNHKTNKSETRRRRQIFFLQGQPTVHRRRKGLLATTPRQVFTLMINGFICWEVGANNFQGPAIKRLRRHVERLDGEHVVDFSRKLLTSRCRKKRKKKKKKKKKKVRWFFVLMGWPRATSQRGKSTKTLREKVRTNERVTRRKIQSSLCWKGSSVLDFWRAGRKKGCAKTAEDGNWVFALR